MALAALAFLGGFSLPARTPAQQGVAASAPLSAAATRDSFAVLRRLHTQVRAHPGDAAAWFHRGTLSLALARSALSRHLPLGATHGQLFAFAEASFRNAARLDSTNTRYWNALASYYGRGSVRGTSPADTILLRVAALARAQHDTTTLVDALWDRAQMRLASWRAAVQANTVPNRGRSPLPGREEAVPRAERDSLDPDSRGRAGALPPSRFDPIPWSVWHAAGKDSIRELPRLLTSAIARIDRIHADLRRRDDLTVPADEVAVSLLEEAYVMTPSSSRVFEALARIYTAASDWPALEGLGRRQTADVPANPWGWLVLGLATQRQGAHRDASAALARGVALLPADVRARLDRTERVLSWSDANSYRTADAVTRSRVAAEVWRFGDPLWSVVESKPREEFLARVTYASLRWAGADIGVFSPPGPLADSRGADTPQGDVYVRYGPPDRIVSGFWIYDSGLVLETWRAHDSLDVRKRAAVEPRETNDRIKDWQPSRWDNVTALGVDSVHPYFARFRRSADSVDLYVAAEVPAPRDARGAGAGATTTAHLWLVPRERSDGSDLYRTFALPASGRVQWTWTAPAGPYYARVETITPGSGTAGRAASTIALHDDPATAFALAGFGLSDLLVATRVAESRSGARWYDLDFAPAIGNLRTGDTVAVIWETYDLDATGSAATYDVKLTLERKWQMFLNRVRARVIGAWAAMMGSEQTGDRVIFRYERTVPAAPAVADHVALALDDIPAGQYDLTVEITDRATGKIAARTVRLVLEEAR